MIENGKIASIEDKWASLEGLQASANKNIDNPDVASAYNGAISRMTEWLDRVLSDEMVTEHYVAIGETIVRDEAALDELDELSGTEEFSADARQGIAQKLETVGFRIGYLAAKGSDRIDVVASSLAKPEEQSPKAMPKPRVISAPVVDTPDPTESQEKRRTTKDIIFEHLSSADRRSLNSIAKAVYGLHPTDEETRNLRSYLRKFMNEERFIKRLVDPDGREYRIYKHGHGKQPDRYGIRYVDENEPVVKKTPIKKPTTATKSDSKKSTKPNNGPGVKASDDRTHYPKTEDVFYLELGEDGTPNVEGKRTHGLSARAIRTLYESSGVELTLVDLANEIYANDDSPEANRIHKAKLLLKRIIENNEPGKRYSTILGADVHIDYVEDEDEPASSLYVLTKLHDEGSEVSGAAKVVTSTADEVADKVGDSDHVVVEVPASTQETVYTSEINRHVLNTLVKLTDLGIKYGTSSYEQLTATFPDLDYGKLKDLQRTKVGTDGRPIVPPTRLVRGASKAEAKMSREEIIIWRLVSQVSIDFVIGNITELQECVPKTIKSHDEQRNSRRHRRRR